MRKVALASVLGYALLMVSGGAVRLTGSGLGCPDWPTCYQHQISATLSFHPMVEFTNRLVTICVTVVSVLAFLVALRRSPLRRDLCWLAGGLVAGVAAQIVLGGIVVLSGLNPYLVACHFLLTIPVLADAVVLYHRSGIGIERDENIAIPLVPTDLRWLSRGLLAVLGVTCAVGTMVAGTGPHAGAVLSHGKYVERIPVAFRDIAEAHSDVAIFLIGLSLASLFAFHRANIPHVAQRRLRLLFELLVLQGIIGYVQFFLHDAAWVIEFHILGVTGLWVTAVGFYVSLHRHPVREADAPLGDSESDTDSTPDEPAAESAPGVVVAQAR
jgi:heme a synthase